jgi:hypothetical protein
MPIICIQCALRAFVNDEKIPDSAYDESVYAHMQRCHPDPEATRVERVKLEAQAREKVRRNLLAARSKTDAHKH